MAKTDLVAPAKIKLPANLMQQLSLEAEQISNRIGAPTGNRIRVTQKKTFRLPNGEESPGPINGIIVDFLSANYYYPGAYDPNDITPPECFALNDKIADLAPHPTVVVKQAEACSICPMNQYGTATTGTRKGKACSNTRLLAILPPDATEDTPILILRVSPTAQGAIDSYIAGVARSHKAPPIIFNTEISLDPVPDYASLRFAPAGPNPILELCMSRRDEARRILMTPPDAAPPAEAVKPKLGRKGK